jgi:hypothetical protein
MDPETMDTPPTPGRPAGTPAITWTPVTIEATQPTGARWSRRLLALVAGCALVALTVGASAAMASDPAASPAGGAIPVDAAAADAAFRDFAACMRKNGIDMPDPVTVTGGPTTVTGGQGAVGTTGLVESGTSIVIESGDAQAVPLDDAAFRAANDACSPILEAAGIKAGTGTIVSGSGSLSVGAAGSAGAIGVVVGGAGGDVTKMAEEMRTYAACMRTNGQDVPDPVVDTRTGTAQMQVNGDPSSAAFRAADQSCSTGGFGFAIPVAPAQP